MDLKDLDLKALLERCHTLAIEKGWWEERTPKPCLKCGYYHRELPEVLMLMASEIFESFEEYRSGQPAVYFVCTKCKKGPAEHDGYSNCEPNYKPEGIATEVIDCIVRIFDWLGHEDIDYEEVLRLKMQFNEDRPFRHGGKKA